LKPESGRGRTHFQYGTPPFGDPAADFQNFPLQQQYAALFWTAHSMQKTKKSVAKRFKLTATGKLLHRSPGTRHIANTKSSKQKRRLGTAKVLSATHTPPLKRCLPHGL
jgi:large subunit ribosomal protein L35